MALTNDKGDELYFNNVARVSGTAGFFPGDYVYTYELREIGPGDELTAASRKEVAEYVFREDMTYDYTLYNYAWDETAKDWAEPNVWQSAGSGHQLSWQDGDISLVKCGETDYIQGAYESVWSEPWTELEN